MKSGILSVFAGVCASACVVLAVIPAQAGGEDETPYLYTVTGIPRGDFLNIRRAPRLNAPIVGKLRNGTRGYMTYSDCWNSRTGKRIPSDRVNLQRPHTWCGVSYGRDGGKFGYARAIYLR